MVRIIFIWKPWSSVIWKGNNHTWGLRGLTITMLIKHLLARDDAPILQVPTPPMRSPPSKSDLTKGVLTKNYMIPFEINKALINPTRPEETLMIGHQDGTKLDGSKYWFPKFGFDWFRVKSATLWVKSATMINPVIVGTTHDLYRWYRLSKAPKLWSLSRRQHLDLWIRCAVGYGLGHRAIGMAVEL